MKHVFVFDPKAFFNQQWKMDGILDSIGQYFRTQEKPDFSIQISRYRRHAILLIQEELEKAQPDDIIRVYAVGGEEILYDCLNAVAHFPRMELAIVPHGESSDFLNIFGDGKAEAFREIPDMIKAYSIPTDVIRWGVNYALNSCYIGLNSATAAKLRTLKSRLGKRGFLIFSRISAFFNYFFTAFDKQIRSQKYTVVIDDNDYSGSYSLIHVANGPYYGGKKTGASEAIPNDGILNVTLIRSAGPFGTMFSIGRYSGGKKVKNGISLNARKILVRSEKQMWIQLDNEYFQDTSIDINIVRDAVNIVAPDYMKYPVAAIAAV